MLNWDEGIYICAIYFVSTFFNRKSLLILQNASLISKNAFEIIRSKQNKNIIYNLEVSLAPANAAATLCIKPSACMMLTLG